MNKTDVAVVFSNMLAVSLADVESILSIISIAVTIVFSLTLIILKVIGYFKNDGKLTKDEIDDLKKDIEDVKDTLQNVTPKDDKKEEHNDGV